MTSMTPLYLTISLTTTSLYHICLSLQTRLSLSKSFLVICKNLRLFVNTFTADVKYSLLNRDNLMQPIPMQLSQKQKTFSQLFSKVLKSRLNFPHLKKMTLIGSVFPKLKTLKEVVR